MTADAANGSPREAVVNDARFEAVVAQEEALLRRIHPTAEDVPGCMTQLDGFLACNSPSVPRLGRRTRA
jgi:ferritin-like protein